MKKEFRYIRYRICRSIYYADQCPRDCRKNYNDIGKHILCGFGMGLMGLAMAVLAIVMA